MESLRFALNAVLPVFILILAGIYLKKKNMLNEGTEKQLTGLLFSFFMPCLLFYNIYSTDADCVVRKGLILFCVISIIAIWAIVSLIACIFIKDMKIRGAAIQGMSRSNFVLFGLPIVGYIMPGDAYGTTSMVAAITVPLVNVLSVLTLEILRRKKISVKYIVRGVVLNPLIIGSGLGFLFLSLSIRLPLFVCNTVETVSSLAAPIGLLVMGAALEFNKVSENKKVLSIAVLTKILVTPILMITLAIGFGFVGADLLTIIVLFAAPTAVTSYPMAVEMESDGDLACQIVVFTTLPACFTTFVYIFLVECLGYM